MMKNASPHAEVHKVRQLTGTLQRQVQTWESYQKLQDGDTTDTFFIE